MGLIYSVNWFFTFPVPKIFESGNWFLRLHNWSWASENLHWILLIAYKLFLSKYWFTVTDYWCVPIFIPLDVCQGQIHARDKETTLAGAYWRCNASHVTWVALYKMDHLKTSSQYFWGCNLLFAVMVVAQGKQLEHK